MIDIFYAKMTRFFGPVFKITFRLTDFLDGFDLKNDAKTFCYLTPKKEVTPP
jgi:hypothetical protein